HLTIPRPRRSTLFPYTTLFRSTALRGLARDLHGRLGQNTTYALFLLARTGRGKSCATVLQTLRATEATVGGAGGRCGHVLNPVGAADLSPAAPSATSHPFGGGFVMPSPNHVSPRRLAVGALLALLVLAASPRAASADGDESETFAAVKAALAANHLQQTKTIGGRGKTPFNETAP